MELEGTLLLERSTTRRWISIIALVIPVASVVMVAAWFVRVYVVPPTVSIASPTMIAAAPPAPAPARMQAPAPQPAPKPKQPDPITTASAAPLQPSPPAAEAPAAITPPAAPVPSPVEPAQEIFASLALAPPDFEHLPPALPVAEPAAAVSAAEAPATASAVPAEPSGNIASEASEAIQGPVPLPRHKPHLTVASIAGAVPLPRPRPAANPEDVTTTPDLPAFDRHTAE